MRSEDALMASFASPEGKALLAAGPLSGSAGG